MQLFFVLLSALAPVAIALYYIFKKDSALPEPAKWLTKAFIFGIGAAFLSFLFTIPASIIFGQNQDATSYPPIISAFADAFLLAAIPEELAKFIMLWILLRKNPFFDEKFDGIVYAVCVSMGFAGLENVMYLINGIEDGSWISTGISRALFSIPGHFLFAVLMGYYYSLYHFNIDRSKMVMVKILIAPILAHGLFDGILMTTQVDERLATFCMFLFLFFMNNLKKKGKERIDRLINQ